MPESVAIDVEQRLSLLKYQWARNVGNRTAVVQCKSSRCGHVCNAILLFSVLLAHVAFSLHGVLIFLAVYVEF